MSKTLLKTKPSPTRKAIVYLGADHRGFRMKQNIAKLLARQEYDVRDLGARRFRTTDDYPTYGFAVARAVAAHPGSSGILLCGSGIGIAIAANRIRGVRAGLAHTPSQAKAGRRDDAMNVLVLSTDFTPYSAAERIISTFLRTQHSTAARHVRRIRMLA